MTLQQKLKELMPAIPEKQVKEAWTWEERVKPTLKDLKYENNSNQLAVAIAATLQFKSNKR